MRFLLLLMLFSGNVSAADFLPHIKLKTIDKNDTNRWAEYSGTVYKIEKDSYHIITCAHGIDEFKNPEVSANLNSGDISIDVKCEIIRQDIRRDLAVLKFKKLSFVSIIPIKISKKELKSEEIWISYGYPGSSRESLSKRNMRKSDLVYKAEEFSLTHCEGVIESGMSGGALLQDEEIIGVLSAKTEDPIGALYVDVNDIVGYVEE